jgi:hypothetical protein
MFPTFVSKSLNRFYTYQPIGDATKTIFKVFSLCPLCLCGGFYFFAELVNKKARGASTTGLYSLAID